MEVYDYSKLLGRMREMGYTQERLAKAIGISETTFNLAVNNKRDFRQDEILKLSRALDVPTAEIDTYFFTRKL